MIGILKMTMPIAWTTSLLAWSLLSSPSAYNGANVTARTLNQVQWGADYLMKTIYKDADNNTQLIYQVRLTLSPSQHCFISLDAEVMRCQKYNNMSNCLMN